MDSPPAKPPPSPIDKEFTFTLDQRRFFARQLPVELPSGTVSLNQDGPTGDVHHLEGPCTVIRTPKKDAPSNWLQVMLTEWVATDDVFCPAFLENIIMLRVDVSNEREFTMDQLGSFHPGRVEAFSVVTSSKFKQGPYFLRNGYLHAVWGVFPDRQEAFMETTIPVAQPSGRYQPLPCSDGRRISIGVPSRLYSNTNEQPLSGVRISVKDNIDLAGTKTTLSSRSWETLYPAVSSTAVAVQQLLDLGAVVVGKTKLSQFAEVESPTGDCVDFHCPFNPRGDGYLHPEGSTSGGAAALASYDWLDVSIGTDTGGSLREPASKQGLFGIRPSWGLVPLDGVFPLAAALDTVGLLARDIDILERIISLWSPEADDIRTVQYPTKIVTFDEFKYQECPAQELFESFISQLREVTKAEPAVMSLNRTWEEGNPSSDGKSILEYIGKQQTMRTIKAYDLWQNTEKFRAEFRNAFGVEPYVNPAVRQQWKQAKDVTFDQQSAALERQRVFCEWFLKSILERDSRDYCNELNTITVVPISCDTPEYRDEYRKGPFVGGNGFHRNFIAPLTGCPEIMVPIGQIGYHSRVSGKEEQLPIVVAILGPPKCDVALTRFVAAALRSAGLPTKVKTGRVAF